MKLTSALSVFVLVAFYISIATAGGGYGHHGDDDDMEAIKAASLLGRCIQYNCARCSNAELLRTVERRSWWSQRVNTYNITACAPNCERIMCTTDENNKKSCICPAAEEATCGFGSECNGCDPSYVTTMFRWKVCCKDNCASPISFSLQKMGSGYRSYYKPICSCASSPDSGTGTGSVDP